MKIRLNIIAFALAFACWQASLAQRADSLTVSFVNFYPGEIIYELEGHSALRIRNGEGLDIAVNYGLFEFAAPNFMYRFVKGETDYYCGAMPWQPCIQYYLKDNRRIVEHPIPLDSAQQARLAYLINENLKPENRVYRYNYVKDNCATRPLRMLEAALGDSIVLPQPTGDAAQAGDTFREIMRYYNCHYPWYQFGIDLALGNGIDYKLTPAEKAFAPVVLDSQLQGATVGGRKLALDPVIVNEGHDATLGPTPWLLTPMAASLAVLALSVAFTVRDIRRRRVTRWFDAALFGIFGLAGCVLTFLIFVSTHEATSPNYLYFWLNPLCLIVPIFIWLKKCKTVVMSYQIANFALIIAMCVAWPFLGQSGNAAFVPLIASDALRAFNYIYANVRKSPHLVQP